MTELLLSRGGKLVIFADEDCNSDADITPIGFFTSLTGDVNITLQTAGSPEVAWRVVESTGIQYEYAGNVLSHTRVANGNTSIFLQGTNVVLDVTHFDASDGGNDLYGIYNFNNFMDYFPSLTHLSFEGNSSITMEGLLDGVSTNLVELNLNDTDPNTYVNSNGNIATFTSLSVLSLNNTSSEIISALSALPASISVLELGSSNSVITGIMSQSPVAITKLNLAETQSSISGAWADIPATLTYLDLGNCPLSVAFGNTNVFPTTVLYFDISYSGCALSGSILDMTTSGCQIAHLDVSGTDGFFTVLTDEYPTTITYIDVSDMINITLTAIVGTASGSRDLEYFGCSNIGLRSEECERILQVYYTDESGGWFVPGQVRMLVMDGNNDAPYGIYQNAIVPSIGQEYAYYLQEVREWVVIINYS